jgi:hypothetical protein
MLGSREADVGILASASLGEGRSMSEVFVVERNMTHSIQALESRWNMLHEHKHDTV